MNIFLKLSVMYITKLLKASGYHDMVIRSDGFTCFNRDKKNNKLNNNSEDKKQSEDTQKSQYEFYVVN